MPETRWTLVQKVQAQGDTQSATDALGTLLQSYWQPLYAYARRRGESPSDAQDIVQGFCQMLISRNSILSVDRERGRLRSFLLAALERFLIDQWEKRSAGKRGGGKRTLSLEHEEAENRFIRETSHSLTPEKEFDRQWVLALLARVLESLRSDYEARGKEAVFEALRDTLEWQGNEESHSATASALGMTENAVKQAVFRMRRKYRELLRAEVALTLSQPEDLDEELRQLLLALGD
ncbi:MAG: sigma-70 family RNA polymerase sigma factor [Verrucomicrobiales bacterium]|nr:sigma-70 family RNA polymerase sigma factor [Verrucomicrobiales bacterium]